MRLALDTVGGIRGTYIYILFGVPREQKLKCAEGLTENHPRLFLFREA